MASREFTKKPVSREFRRRIEVESKCSEKSGRRESRRRFRHRLEHFGIQEVRRWTHTNSMGQIKLTKLKLHEKNI